MKTGVWVVVKDETGNDTCLIVLSEHWMEFLLTQLFRRLDADGTLAYAVNPGIHT